MAENNNTEDSSKQNFKPPDSYSSNNKRNDNRNLSPENETRSIDEMVKPLDNENESNFNFLLEQLNLNAAKKLGVKKFFTVSKSSFSSQDLDSANEIPEYILQKLMIVDYNARNLRLVKSQEEFSDSEDDDSDDNRHNDKHRPGVNPMDAFFALFLCCDDFLRHHLALKLTACQLSVPFLLPDPGKPSENITMLLWALSGIKKSWKMVENEKDLDKQVFVTRHPFPIVSFVRLGKVGMSKSRLMNEILSDINGHRNFFFHKDCKGGDVERKFVDGLVELCWYLPGGRDGQAFEHEMCFANLRGDAKMFEKQFRILSKISSLLILLLPSTNVDTKTEEILARIMRGEGKVLLVFKEKREGRTKVYFDDLKTHNPDRFSVIIRDMKKNKDKFVTAVRGKIQQHVKDAKSLQIKDLPDVIKEHGVVVDQYMSNTFTENIAKWFKNDPKQAKAMLRLQSVVPIIANLERENVRPTRRGEKSQEEYSNEIQKKIKDAKQFQKESLKKIDEDVRKCLNHIPLMAEKERNYCLMILKQELDNMSLEFLPPLQSAYRKEWFSIVQSKKKQDKDWPNDDQKSQAEQSCNKRLQVLEKEMVQSSFGLAHIFREMAQIFMLTEISVNDHAGAAAAKMLLSGSPLELMDGDSSYIPLKWFYGVFDQLKVLIDNAKIFVISVLGIQSSGKSTMLNTMFGLEFPVSAGRCTRGAFASLIPLSDTIKKDTKCEYFLVIDTEGLKGSADPHLRQHDNELATFAIGVADLTIVNIFGENYNDMKEFLEIAVHAFLKMKLAKKKRVCQIVHQNVTALDASRELDLERMNLRKKLDEMTRLAAVEENCENKFQQLNDVLVFDEKKDVYYIPSLLQGCPPMAPMNPEYGKAVQRVKENIIEVLYSPDKSPISISQFQKRVDDVWDAIRRENFIFSFRNTIEVRAYTSLDRKLFEVFVNTVVTMGEQEKKTSTALERSPPEKRQDVWEEQKIEIRKTATNQGEIMKRELKSFFETNQDKNTLEQWRGNTMNKIKQLKENQEEEVVKNCRAKFRYLESRQEIDKMKVGYKDKLLANAKEFITSVESTDDVDVCLSIFEKAWQRWINDIPDCKVIKFDVNGEMINVLCEHNKKHSGLMQWMIYSSHYKIREFRKVNPVSKDDLIVESWTTKIKNYWCNNPHVHDARIICDKAIDAARKFAKEISYSNERCTKLHLIQLYQTIHLELDKGTEGRKFMFCDNVICEIILHGFANAYPIFEEMEDRYIKEHDIELDLELNLKPDLQNYFFNQCKKMNKEVAAATLFVDILKKPIQSEINQSMGLVVAKELLTMGEFQSKGNFHAKRLIELGEAGSFDNYIPYLQNPVKFLKSKLNESIEIQVETNPLVSTLLEKEVNRSMGNIFEVISDTARQMSLQGQGIDGWIRMFIENCPGLAVTRDMFSVVTIDEDLKDFGIFWSEVETKVSEVFQGIIGRGVNLTVYQEWRPRPYDKLADLMFGCEECCMFCRALCDQTIKNHDCSHSTRNHRPQGIGSYRWLDTGILLTDMCTSLVAGERNFRNVDTNQQSHLYKSYQTVNDYYKSWSVAPDVSFEASHYWKWFMAKYPNELAQHYACNPPEIPSSWKNITFEEAKSQIEAQYNL